MRVEETKESIRKLLTEQRLKPLTGAEIAAALSLRGKNCKALQKWLNELEKAGEIVRIRENRYALGAAADLVTGVLSLARSGNGFVTDAGDSPGADVFVPRDDVGTALPGDRVLVRLDPALGVETGRDRAGKIIRILERAKRDIVGTLRSTGRFLYVVPVDPSFQQDFYVPGSAGANVNDRVVIRFTGWENRHVSPEAEIVEILGPSTDPSIDTLAVIRHFGFRAEFPAEVVAEAEQASGRIERAGRRDDLRDLYILTIDPARARDFDDALSLTQDSNGQRVLGVHIADVSHFVRPGSALDAEARERGNSIYFADKVLPMLPEQLSNGVCSLRPDEDRLAFSVFMTVSAQGQVVARRFARSIIRSRLRLNYEQAMAAMDGRATDGAEAVPPEAVKQLKELNRLAQQFRGRRFAQWALDLDIPACEVVIGADGMMTGLRVVENDASHQLVEECMVAANEAVAAALSEAGLPLISRLHEPPAEEKIEELAALLAGMGYHPGDLNRQRHLAEFLASIKDDALAHHVRVAVLRSMKRAVYSADGTGHYGLAKKFYAHFTSPIRRYPDLVVHRQLAAMLDAGRGKGHAKPYALAPLGAMAAHCTDTEFKADEAERALLEIKKYRFLEREIEEQKLPAHDAVIVAVTNFGMFVELLSLQLQGLVHVSTISDQFVRFDRQRQTLRAGKQVFKTGQTVRVVVKGVDFDKRRIDLALASQPSPAAGRSKSALQS